MSSPPDELLETISKRLLFLWYDARKSSTRMTNAEDAVSHYVSNEKGYFNYSLKGVRCLEKLCDTIKDSIDEFDEKFSKRFLRSLLKDVMFELLDIEEPHIKDKTVKKAEEIHNKLAGDFADFYISTPIDNFKMEVESLQIGDVFFRLFSKPELPPTESESFIKSRADIETRFYPRCEGKIMSRVKVKALDLDKAKELGKQVIGDALNIIRFYGLNGAFPQPSFAKNYFDIIGTINPSKNLFFVENPSVHNEVLPELQQTGWLFPFELNQVFYDEMHRLGFDTLNSIIQKHRTERADIEHRLYSAARMAGTSFMHEQIQESFLKLMISLEALLLEDRESKKDNLAERVAFVLTDDPKDRLIVYHMMRDLYEIRSSIVHEGNEEISQKDFVQLRYYTFLTIITMLDKHKTIGFKTIGQFKEWILRQKFA